MVEIRIHWIIQKKTEKVDVGLNGRENGLFTSAPKTSAPFKKFPKLDPNEGNFTVSPEIGFIFITFKSLLFRNSSFQAFGIISVIVDVFTILIKTFS